MRYAVVSTSLNPNSCLILPRFVYATGQHFGGPKLADESVRKRVQDLALELDRVAGALARKQ
jgi:FMN reductase